MILERKESTAVKPINTTLEEPKAGRLTRTKLVARVAEEVDLSKAQTKRIIDAMLDIVTRELAAGNRVTLTGFGTFEVRTSKARKGVNPRTLEPITIPARRRAAFAPGAALKRVIEK